MKPNIYNKRKLLITTNTWISTKHLWVDVFKKYRRRCKNFYSCWTLLNSITFHWDVDTMYGISIVDLVIRGFLYCMSLHGRVLLKGLHWPGALFAGGRGGIPGTRPLQTLLPQNTLSGVLFNAVWCTTEWSSTILPSTLQWWWWAQICQPGLNPRAYLGLGTPAWYKISLPDPSTAMLPGRKRAGRGHPGRCLSEYSSEPHIKWWFLSSTVHIMIILVLANSHHLLPFASS